MTEVVNDGWEALLRAITFKLMEELQDRKGFDDLIAELDEDVQQELWATLAKLSGETLLEAIPRAAELARGDWVAVPQEATEEMSAAGWIDKEDVSPAEIWGAMVAASLPQPQKDDRG